MSKITAISNAARFARIGAGLKSGAILFSLALINQLGFHRWQSRAAVARFLRLWSDPQGYIQFVVRMPFGNRTVSIRAGDFADYQTAWECLSGTMYRLPSRPVKYVIDGGANIGLFSVYVAGHLGVPVLAIEPAPKNLPILEKNIGSMSLVSMISVALAATDGIAKFNLASSNTGHLDGFDTGNDSEQSCEVRTVRLASIIPPEWDQSCLWLKLDIEGAEYEVLREALHDGIRPAVISGEIHNYFGANGAGLVAELESLNYSVIVEGSGDSGNVCRQIHAELR